MMCSRVYTTHAGVGDNPAQTPEDPDSSRHPDPVYEEALHG